MSEPGTASAQRSDVGTHDLLPEDSALRQRGVPGAGPRARLGGEGDGERTGGVVQQPVVQGCPPCTDSLLQSSEGPNGGAHARQLRQTRAAAPLLHGPGRETAFSTCTRQPRSLTPTPPTSQVRAHAVVLAMSQATANMPANLKKIVMAFQAVPDPMARYKQLLFFASKLKPMAAELHTPENKVQGCVSQAGTPVMRI